MSGRFRVALSGDFRKDDGSPVFPDFDLAPLRSAPGVEMEFLESANPLRPGQLEDFDALILLAHRFASTSVPKSGRLAVVARFGVGYDTVDVPACTAADIALAIPRWRQASGRRVDHHFHSRPDRQADGQG